MPKPVDRPDAPVDLNIPRFGYDVAPVFVQDDADSIKAKLRDFYERAVTCLTEYDRLVEADLEANGDGSIYADEDYSPNALVRLPVAVEEGHYHEALPQALKTITLAIETAPEFGFTVVDIQDFHHLTLLGDRNKESIVSDFGILVGLGFGLTLAWGRHSRKVINEVADQCQSHERATRVAVALIKAGAHTVADLKA